MYQIDENENIRERFKPNKIKVLFIGESPPASGGFFYKEDSLCGYTQQSFAKIFPEAAKMTRGEFLKFFMNKGCFLDDLCHILVNKLSKTEKMNHCKQAVPLLASRIKQYQPDVIIIMLLKIVAYVKDAIIISKLQDINYWAVPYGGYGNQNRYIEELSIILDQLVKDGIISP